VVADCLGKLTLLDAARLLPALQVHLALTPPPLSVVTLDAGPHSAAPTALTHTVGRHPEQVRQCKGAEVYSETSSGEGVPIDPKLTRAGIKPPARGGNATASADMRAPARPFSGSAPPGAPKVDTNCTTPSLIPTVNGTRFSASIRTDTSPQRKEARPRSHARHPKNSTFGLLGSWFGPEMALLIGYFAIRLLPPRSRPRCSPRRAGAALLPHTFLGFYCLPRWEPKPWRQYTTPGANFKHALPPMHSHLPSRHAALVGCARWRRRVRDSTALGQPRWRGFVGVSARETADGAVCGAGAPHVAVRQRARDHGGAPPVGF
jgi:hypothetical protein